MAEAPAGRLWRWIVALDERWPGARRRAGGLALALALEAALFFALLTLGVITPPERKDPVALTTVDFAPEPQPSEEAPEPDRPAKPSALPRPAPAPAPRPEQLREITPPIPLPPPAAVLPVERSEAPPPNGPKIKAVVRGDEQGPAAPAGSGASADSQRVGTRPNGEPVYGARWYREPTDGELRGYLSTASGPGWAIITCRTVPGYRVEDCELEDEYPSGAQIGRAVMAAAWQFQVRPPQIGGRVLVGEWVRIRITYEVRRK